MKYYSLRITALLLVLVMLLPLAVSCGGGDAPATDENTPSEDGGSTDTPSTPAKGDFVLSDTTAYKVVVSEYASKSEEQAARLIRNALEELYGEKPKLSSDWLTGAPTEEEVASWCEILVGDVDRVERKAATAAMGGDNFIIRVEGNKLLVLGATDEMTLKAAEYFVGALLKDEKGAPRTFLSAGFAYSQNYDPVLVETLYDPDDVIVANIVATDYPYLADPTGKTDSTAAIQSALDALHSQGGGTVYLPAGTYLVTSTVTIPTGCLLKGDWQNPDSTDSPAYGTVILAQTPVLDEAYLSDRTRDPLISLTQNCAIDGLTFYYPDQDAANVRKYGYTLYSQAPSCMSISNVTLLNSYRGIGIDVHCDDSHELVQVENVYMTVLETGFEEYHSTEVGNIVGIHVSPDYWAEAGAGYACKDADALRDFCRENTVAMQFNGLDDTHLSELRIEGCRTAIYMPTGYTTHDYWGVIYDVTIEDCDYGIVAESLNPYGGGAIAKATIDASEVAVYNSSSTGALKLSDVTALGKGGIVAVGEARIYEDDTSDLYDYTIRRASYQKPAANLYVAPVLNLSRTRQDISTALQQTLDEAAATGGIVYIPAGVYSIHHGVNVPEGVELRGAAPFFMRDAQSSSEGIDGTVLLTYVLDGPTVTLAKNAGVNGLRIFCGANSPESARDLLKADDPATTAQSAIKGTGENVYAHNVTLTTTFNGIDFTDCDNFSIKHAFGAVYNDFIIAGGKGGVVEQCLTNQHFLNRQHFLTAGLLDSAYYKGWEMNSEMTAIFRDEVRRVYGDMVHLVDAEDVCVSNIFTYGPRCLVLCENSSATLLNTSSDFHGMGPMFDIRDGSDVVAVNALRSANESIGCDESSSLRVINRIAISRFNEPNFDSANGNVDEITYRVSNKTMINDGSKAVTSTTLHNGAMAKTDGTSLYHAAPTTSSADANLYSQTGLSIDAAPYLKENAYLHLWVYVEDMTSSIWTGSIRLYATKGQLMWSNICYVTHNGWNELWLPIKGALGTISGKITGLTMDDKRSVFARHSDYYFDDIYLCTAESVNPEPIKRTDSLDVSPLPDRGTAALPEQDDTILLACDSLYGSRARTTPVRVLTDPAYVKVGSGAWQLTAGTTSRQVVTKPADVNVKSYMKHGYLHLWLYVEDLSALSGGYVELTSSGECDKDEISWEIRKHVTQAGWNELWLPLNTPDSTSGEFSPAKLNYFRIYTTLYRETIVCIDDVRFHLPADAPAADAPEAVPDVQRYAFKVGSDEEAAVLSGRPNFNAATNIRFADNTSSFTYSYFVGDFSKLQGIKWSAPLSGQLLLEVSTDEVNWTEVYRYESDNTADSGLAREVRTYNLTDYVTERGSKCGYVYVRISDAYTENGFGGAIAASDHIEMVLYYVPVDPSELEGTTSGGSGEGEIDIPDTLPATEKHVFYAGTPGEVAYLYDSGNSSVMYGNRFADAARYFIYAIPVYDFAKLNTLTFTATTLQQLHISVSADAKSWVDVYKFDNSSDRGLDAAERDYELLPLIGNLTGAGKVYLRISDSDTSNGYGGAVTQNDPITFSLAYTGGVGDVVKEGELAPEEEEIPLDPDNMPVADTPRPEGEVDQKLMVHDCETLEGAGMQWVPVSLNTNAMFVKEGTTSWCRTGSTLEYVSISFDGMDVSEYMENGYLHMWVYVTNYNLKGGGQIELTSSGSCDKNELHWEVTDYITGTGWNEVFVPLSKGTQNNPDLPFDPTAANFIRIFCGTTDGTYKTMYFDDIYFCTMK